MMDEQPPPSVAPDQIRPHQAVGEDRHASLFARLRSQAEFYFSPQNLARDTYLRNMLTSEHPDVPTPRPGQFMCPVGVITNFPKVRDICAQFGEDSEPPALLLAKALQGSNVVVVSSEGNWIGPLMQSLPPQTMGGGAPPRAPQHPPHFQQPHPYQHGFQQGPYPPNHIHQQRLMPMIPPTAQQGDGAAMQYQPSVAYSPHAHYSNETNATAPTSMGGSESPSSASLESMPSQQQQQQAQLASNIVESIFIAVMDLPSEANPIEILSAFTTQSITPKSAFVDGNTGTWFVSFNSEADAKVAMQASRERTISGAPILAKLNNELPASSKVTVTSASAASLSSASIQGGQMVHPQQQQMPLAGQQQGAFPFSQGPSPPPPMTAQNVMPPYPPAGVPQYAMPLPMQMPPGQPYPQPFYSSQQVQHMYPGGYMQSQPHGGPQQPQMQPYPLPQMGARYGVPPPPPPRVYPGGPPPPPYSQFQAVPQYMGDGYGGQYHGHPPPHRQYGDRRQAGQAAMGVFQDPKRGNDAHTKKKKQNKNNQQHHRRDYGAGSGDNNSNNGQRRNIEYNSYGGNFHQRHDNSSSPVPNDNRGKWRKRTEYGDQFRRSHGHTSPSFNRHYTRQNDRLSSSDRTPTGSSSKQNKVAEGKEIFSSSDFPGLGGGAGEEKSDRISQQDSGDGNKQLVGYASALLKKKEAENKKTEAETEPAAIVDNDVDSITRQTEEMEREILSEFHDLSLIGEGNKKSPPSPPAEKNQGTDDKMEGQTVGTASSSTTDARSPPNNMLPILPGPFPENDGVISQTYSSPKQEQPAIDVTSSQDFPSRESTNAMEDTLAPPPATTADPPVAKEQTSPLVSDESTPVAENPQPPGAWGNKRFADVI